jgi:HemY protein
VSNHRRTRPAHEQKHFQTRDDYLQQLERVPRNRAICALMTQAELLLEDRRYHDALQALARLQDKHTAALRLELRAHQQAQNWDQVLSLLPQLDKRQVLEHSLLDQVRRYALDRESQAQSCRRQEPARILGSPAARAEAREPHRGGGGAKLHRARRVQRSACGSWSRAWTRTGIRRCCTLYVECLPRDARRHLERAEGWLKEHPGDPLLLLALGELCMQQELWGKARSYLEASLAVDPSHSAFVQLGRLLERIGKPEEASQAYRRGLELTLGQLKLTTGGRRRVPL